MQELMTDAYPDQAVSLGALLRAPYRQLADWLYQVLPIRGFPDVRAAHSAVFRHIPEAGATVSELAKAARMTKQSMSYLVDDLERLGYVESAPDIRDRRAKCVRLSRRGHELVQEALALSRAYEQALRQVMGDEDIDALRRILGRLKARLDDGLLEGLLPGRDD